MRILDFRVRVRDLQRVSSGTVKKVKKLHCYNGFPSSLCNLQRRTVNDMALPQSVESPSASTPEAVTVWLAAWRGKSAGKIFCFARFLPLFFDARSQLNLIRILRPRRATRQQNSADNRDGKQDGPHVRDHAIH